jgi:glyoxylase-like metal-dependent hydrolase (beta-lactamase superfamily II)
VQRREVLKGALGGLLVLGAAPFARGAQAQSTAVRRLNDKLSVIDADGSNVVAFSTADGLVLVDSGPPQHRQQLMSQLGALPGGGRVHTVFNTHYHLDQTGSNEVFGSAGAKIIAHVNTKLWMSTDYYIPAEERYEKPRPKAAHPTETFFASGSLKAGGEQIDYGYLIEAHTNGDIYVFFRDSNVLAVGDVSSPDLDPALDYFTGAWIGGRVNAMDALLKLSNNDTKFVPAHGRVIARAEFQVERDMMATVLDRLFERVREGESAEDMLARGLLDGLPRKWKDPLKFLYDAHKGLWAHHNKLNPNVV